MPPLWGYGSGKIPDLWGLAPIDWEVGLYSYLDTEMSILENRPTTGQP